ncbi:hypothetical protein [Daejeonella sp.]|uniref:hypothetical protein n=1 Tax=Daejeonella sp. TaxID=2805397 RepID=UPI0030C38E91
MKKNLLKKLLCLFALAAVAPGYASFAQQAKGLTRTIIINNGDTTVNGKKFSELDKIEKAKLRDEFKEMEKNFRSGNVMIRKGGGDTKEVVISRNGKEPNVLIWNDNIDDNAGSFGFNIDRPRALNMLKHNGDSMFFDKDFQMFSFNGDTSMSFNLNTDSLSKRFNFKIDGLDSSMRKRVITMNRDVAAGRNMEAFEFYLCINNFKRIALG